MSVLRVIGNIIWLIVVGLTLGLSLLVSGVLMCLTIIGIPFGIQAFKLSVLALWPFGRVIVQSDDTLIVFSSRACITIIGIPFGLILFRMVPLIAWPFGKSVVPAGSGGSYSA